MSAKKVKAIFLLTDGPAEVGGKSSVAFVSRRPAGAATANRCIAGAHPERPGECRGELKSFTST